MVRSRVLVVDDEESMRYFLSRALKKKGYDVTTVASGEEAIATLAGSAPDVALLDLKLPGMDGIEVLAEVKRQRPGTIVILMTGYGTVERALEAMRRGAADFVTKPFAVEEVLAKIEEARRRGGAPRPLVPYLVESAESHGLPVSLPEDGDLPYREASRLFEALYFLELFERTGGNVSLAARISGISRPSLHRKINELGIDVERYRKT